MITAAITLDQSAAFDCISHDVLIRKLKLYNFGENSVKWIESYLAQRSQYVNIGTKSSSFWTVCHGVPQGSVLGPIMYVIYVNELPQVVKDEDNCQHLSHKPADNLFVPNCPQCGSVPSYADDVTFMVTGHSRFSNQERLSTNAVRLKTFLNDNNLSINMGKTAIIEIMTRQKRVRLQDNPPPQLTVTTLQVILKNIQTSDHCRLLGANIDKDMSWKSHLTTGPKALIPALRTKIGALQHFAKYLPKQSRLLLANGLIISKLLYLITVWGGPTVLHEKTAGTPQQDSQNSHRITKENPLQSPNVTV